jgi:hypothetical protein
MVKIPPQSDEELDLLRSQSHYEHWLFSKSEDFKQSKKIIEYLYGDYHDDELEECFSLIEHIDDFPNDLEDELDALENT